METSVLGLHAPVQFAALESRGSIGLQGGFRSLFNSQVSSLYPPKRCPYCRGSSHLPPHIPELIIKIQRSLLNEDTVDENDDHHSWTLAHVMKDFVNPTTSERSLVICYEDGHEDLVLAGAVHRLQ